MSAVKSIANSAEPSPNEVQDIVTTVQKDDASTCFKRIMKIYTQSHLYLAQWKALSVDIDCLKRNIALVRRFEASGLQLEGKGLWLLSMLLEYSCNAIIIDEPTHTVLFDTLLRVAVETNASTMCTYMLLLLIRKFDASCSHLFQTGCNIADQLPASIAADNFIALLDFALVCMERDSSCALLACKFLVHLAANVTPNHKANYFLHGVVQRLGPFLLPSPTATDPTTEAEADQQNSPVTGEQEAKMAAQQNQQELQAYIYVLLAYLTPLHPNHAQIMLTHPVHLPLHTVERLRFGQLSEAGECAALLFLDSLCIDTDAKDELKRLISVDMMRAKMSIFTPTVTEKATKLFLSLFAEDIECNYRPRSSVDVREIGHSLRSHSAAEGEEPGSGHSRESLSARSDCSWSMSSVTCLRDLLSIALNITENALKAQTAAHGASEGQNGENSDKIGGPDAEEERSHAGAAFHYLNSIVYHVGLCVQVHRIFSLHDVVARIVALILAQFENVATFDLTNAKIVDTLFLLIGYRERCWQPMPADAIDADYLHLSSALVEHFMSIADPLLTDSSDDRTLPSSPTGQESTASTMLNSKVVKFATDHFLRDGSFLENFLEEWEVESIENICRKLLLLYCRLQLGGLEAITSLVELEPFEEVLWDLLSDDRHGIDQYPEMRRKCIQLFTAIGVHMQPPTVAPAPAVGEAPAAEPAPPKELAHAAPLAELAIKILCTQEHSSVGDEEDPADLAFLQLPPSSSIATRNGMGTPAATASSVAGHHGPVRTEAGRCVSQIFRAHKHALQLRYSCLSCVMHICETTRTVRRKVIANYAEIVKHFSYLDPVRSMVPLLQLVALAAEYLTKLESVGGESIVTLLVRCLRYPDAIVRTAACEVIAAIGSASPGLVHRGICRPEVEDLLIDILVKACAEEEPQQHSGPLVRSVLKACNALTHDINIRPGWVPSPYTYHWSRYSTDVSTRPLFGPPFLDLLQLVVRRASRTYIIQYCALVLSIVTCLMYSCNDGVFAAKSGDAHVQELKSALLSKFLPWMPVTLDYLTSHRKILRSLMIVPLPAAPGSAEGSPSSTAGSSPVQATSSPKSGAASSAAASTAPTPAPSDKSTASAPPAAPAKGDNKDANKVKMGGLNIMNRIKRKSNAPNTLVMESVVLPDRKQDVRYSLSAENLAEKLIEALHAFLCMDEMFPLSTYLQNATMFNGTPVIACVSYFMTECRTNLKLQRRGIDFLRHFADNQIGLSSIAMHSPSAILHASRLLSDTLDVQYSFCKIVLAVAKSDEFARENFIRFNVQSWLAELMQRQHAEQSRLACMAATELCVSQSDLISVCQGTGVIEAAVALLDALPTDFRVQVEALRLLATAEQVPELMVPVRKASAAQILKKSKKFLVNALKQESFPDGYERADVEALLNSPVWAKDPLLSKIMGFFS